ncbi:hypothetical protein ACFWN7_05060 [Agromyces sp. NPDC058484]
MPVTTVRRRRLSWTSSTSAATFINHAFGIIGMMERAALLGGTC